MTTDVEILRLLAKTRKEYATAAPSPDDMIINNEAAAFEAVAHVLAGEATWAEIVAAYAPSWRWHEFGEHDPLPKPNPAWEGWWHPMNARRWHYVVGERSLCGRWLYLGTGEGLRPHMGDDDDDCKVCARRRRTDRAH